MLEHGNAVEANARDAGDSEFHRQHVALLAGGVVTGRAVDGAHGAVGKGFGVEAGSSLRVLVVPQANRVLGHCMSLSSGFWSGSSLRAKRSNPEPHMSKTGLLRRYAPRNDGV